MYVSVCLCTASGQRLSIAARIEQFYREVKQKSKELCGENEYDTRYIQYTPKKTFHYGAVVRSCRRKISVFVRSS